MLRLCDVTLFAVLIGMCPYTFNVYTHSNHWGYVMSCYDHFTDLWFIAASLSITASIITTLTLLFQQIKAS